VKIAVPFALMTLFLSLRFTANVGWNHHEEWQGDYYTGLALKGMVTCAQPEPIEPCEPSAYRFPVYPVVLGIMLQIFGGEPGARLFQSVLAGMITFMAVILAYRYGEKRGAISAGAIILASWSNLYFASMLMTETLFTFLIVIFVAGWTRWG
jgi:4-amino-4-deoxy-L-arabinose transferase-like glycosyltransferase